MSSCIEKLLTAKKLISASEEKNSLDWTGLWTGLDYAGWGFVFFVSALVCFRLCFSVTLQIISRGQLLTQQYLAPFLFNIALF